MLVMQWQVPIPLHRTAPVDYITPVAAEISAPDAEGELHPLGIVAGRCLSAYDIHRAGEDLRLITDMFSEEMSTMARALFTKQGRVSPTAADTTPDRIVLYTVLRLHPQLDLALPGILDALAGPYAPDVLFGLPRELARLSDGELSDLGFAKLARTDWVFRYEGGPTRYGSAHPHGLDFQLTMDVATAAAEFEPALEQARQDLYWM